MLKLDLIKFIERKNVLNVLKMSKFPLGTEEYKFRLSG